MLYLHMAALASVEKLPISATTLLENTVAHEQRYWSKQFEDKYAEEILDSRAFQAEARRMVAAITLLGGVQDGQGTMGLFARDARLYEAAVLTLERFSELMASLRRITGKIEEDGYITIGQTTPVGTFTKKFPVGQRASDAR